MKKNYAAPLLSVVEVESQAFCAASPDNYDSKMNDGDSGDDAEGYLGGDATSKGTEFWED